jgi:predicted NACHT family NTPase
VGNWFSEARDLDSGTAAWFDRLLFDRANLATLELARTPLLLTFLCLSYDEGQQFPANRSSLYRRAMQILLEKWAAEKRIHHEDIYQDLNTDIEIEMLAEVAAFFYDREQTLFLAEELKERLRYFIENTMDLKLPPVSRIIEAIEVQQGLLVQRSADVYSFSHLTIQEYLTAFYYYVPGRMPQLIAARLFDPKWREVFLLQAGMSHSEGLLREMLRVLKAHVEKHEVLKTAIA